MDYEKQKEIFDREAEFWDKKDRSDCSENIYKTVSLSEIRKGMTVLDVGCGTGIMCRKLSETVGDKGFVKAIDISAGMLKIAKNKFANYKNILFEEANIETFSDKDAVYDTVICNNVFPHFINTDNVLKNCFRLLKHGGIFTVSHLKGRNFVNNIHKETENFKGDRVPELSVWTSMFEKYGFTHIYSEDSENFYIIVMKKI